MVPKLILGCPTCLASSQNKISLKFDWKNWPEPTRWLPQKLKHALIYMVFEPMLLLPNYMHMGPNKYIDIVPMYGLKMPAKYWDADSTWSGLLGLWSGDGQWCHQLENAPFKYCFTISCNFQTKLMRDVKSMAVVPMHEWKTPLKYWDMLLLWSGWLRLPWCS